MRVRATGPARMARDRNACLGGDPHRRFADAPPRLAAELAGADVVAAEDTRRLRRLTQALGVTARGRVVSYFEGNERPRTPELVEALVGGAAWCCWSPTPGCRRVSDPGYRLVAAAVEADINVTAVPGPSAVLTALALSGLPVDRFCFEGFLPRKAGERLGGCAEVADERAHAGLLRGAAPARRRPRGDGRGLRRGAPAAVCRELTKTYEEVKRGGRSPSWPTGPPRASAGRSPSSSRARRPRRARARRRRSWPPRSPPTRRRARRASRPSPTSPSASTSRNGPCTTPSCARANSPDPGHRPWPRTTLYACPRRPFTSPPRSTTSRPRRTSAAPTRRSPGTS